MRDYIKQNKWLILFISFLAINIGYMIYSHEMKKDVMQLDGSSLVLKQEVDEDSQQNQNNKPVSLKEEIIPPIEASFIEGERNDDQEITTEVLTESQVIKEVPIYICGEIKRPGVYYVPINAIINDVIEKGGGFTEEANQIAINLASQIIPNEKIIVPKMGEEIDKSTDSYDNRERIESSFVSPQPNNSLAGAIDLNTATKEQLMTLSGIGEVKAAAIIAYRQEKGTFSSIDELKNISGIGEKTFEKIKQFITT